MGNLNRNKIQYYVLCVEAFANTKQISQRDAFTYLYDNKGIEFLVDCYEAEHTLSLDDSILTQGAFKVRLFNNPDIEWAHFVINNRNRAFSDILSPECNIDNKYDIVSGPVANDDLVALLNLFIAGTISNAVLASEMTYRKMTSQISFHTGTIIAHLIKTGALHG